MVIPKIIASLSVVSFSYFLGAISIITSLIVDTDFIHNECQIIAIVRDAENNMPIKEATIRYQGQPKGEAYITKMDGTVIFDMKDNVDRQFTASKADDGYISGDNYGGCSEGKNVMEFKLFSKASIRKRGNRVKSLMQEEKYEEALREIEALKKYYPKFEDEAFRELKDAEMKIRQHETDLLNNNSSIRTLTPYETLDEKEFRKRLEGANYEDLQQLLDNNKDYRRIIKEEIKKQKKVDNIRQ